MTVDKALQFWQTVQALGDIAYGLTGTKRPVPSVYRTECAAGQWVKGAKYPFELKITSNAGHELIPVEQATTPLA